MQGVDVVWPSACLHRHAAGTGTRGQDRYQQRPAVSSDDSPDEVTSGQ